MLAGLVILVTPRVGELRTCVLLCRKGGVPLCVNFVLRGFDALLPRTVLAETDLPLLAAGRTCWVRLFETAAALPPVILIQL